MASSKNPKTPAKTKNIDKKNITSKIIGMPWTSCFQISNKQKKVFEGVFDFFDKEKPCFECIKSEDLRWN